MKKRGGTFTERLLVIATAGVLFLALGVAAWSIHLSQQRTSEYFDRALEVDQQVLRIRLSGLVHEFEQSLWLERAALEAMPAVPGVEDLVQRWRPLLGQHWALSKVALADEHGNETALLRSQGELLLRRTIEGSLNAPAMVSRPGEGPGIMGEILGSEYHDPRKRLWFSKALEESRDAPVWTSRKLESDTISRLQLSLLWRDDKGNGPFRILMFEVDAERSSWLGPASRAQHRQGMFVVNSDGDMLDRSLPPEDPELTKAMASAVAHWDRERPIRSFPVEVDERRFMALVTPYAMNGQTLYSGVVLDASGTPPFLKRERQVLHISSVLLLVLTLLLGSLWWKRRMADAEIKKQERRSRSQELRLAKALGEREVLNREVHHRVKNNLQVVSSLLNLQASGLDEGPVRSEFLRGKKRIDTIALVHHKLYALKDLRNVDLELFFGALALASAEMNRPQSLTVSFEVDTHGLKCDQDTAIGLGMILCELMSNCFQHAFPYATGGHIDVQVQAVEGDLYRLVVKDNGKGLQPDGITGPGKLGLEIVEALADQLDGSFHTRSNGGTTFEVLFRMRPALASADAVATEADGLQ